MDIWKNLAKELEKNPKLCNQAITLDNVIDKRCLAFFENDTGYAEMQLANTESLIWKPFLQMYGTLGLISCTSDFVLQIVGKRGARKEHNLVDQYAGLYTIEKYNLRAKPLDSCTFVSLPQELKVDKPCWLNYTINTKRNDGKRITEQLQVLYSAEGKIRQTTMYSTQKGNRIRGMGVRVFFSLDNERTEVCMSDMEEGKPLRIRII